MTANWGKVEGSETREHDNVENKALNVLEMRKLEIEEFKVSNVCGGESYL